MAEDCGIKIVSIDIVSIIQQTLPQIWAKGYHYFTASKEPSQQ